MIKSESDVRRILREWYPKEGDIYWIEPGLGGTDGLPDCFVPSDGWIQFIELKAGILKRFPEHEETDVWWKPELRPRQRVVLENMVKKKHFPLLLIGEIGSVDMVFAATASYVLRRMDNDQMARLKAVADRTELEQWFGNRGWARKVG